ncbi:MAG: hypothetical protein ACYCYI_02555 [Saccharofermentanales bacterium]
MKPFIDRFIWDPDFSSASGIGAEIDAAYRRIWIEGWRISPQKSVSDGPDPETGYVSGFYKPDYDDSSWDTSTLPGFSASVTEWIWSRTHVFIPDDCRGKEIMLMLGSQVFFRAGYLRVFVNGLEAGVFASPEVDSGLIRIDLTHGSVGSGFIRFGNDNIIALQHCGISSLIFEQYLNVGAPLETMKFEITNSTKLKSGERYLSLASSDRRLSAKIIYRSDHNGSVVIKSTKITNESDNDITLMNISLGTYETQAKAQGGWMGFPVYIGSDHFIAIAHPAGWTSAADGKIRLRQFPGKTIRPGESFQCMDAVFGAADNGKSQQLFKEVIEKQMRRKIRGHDRPYAILDFFAGWPAQDGLFGMTEEYCLQITDSIEHFQKSTNENFDFNCLEFWCEKTGDFTQFNKKGFPGGYDRVRDRLKSLGIAPGLWTTSSSGRWNIAENPLVYPSRIENEPYTDSKENPQLKPYMCAASDPYKSLISNGFAYHARENGVRLFKFDDLRYLCYSIRHPEHLPGIYSIEPICVAMIKLLQTLDEVSPDVFLMLYWGYSSPWWLLYGDTIFESGWGAEAASPSAAPSLYARDGVIVSMDQQVTHARDANSIPVIGHDTLGIWLSDWGWNSSIGKERWQEGMVMDLCRGSLLLQPWTDRTWLTDAERILFGEFLHILRKRPECFACSRRIIGDAMKNEPYGYACTNGTRGFIAVHNCSWQDLRVELKLGSEWGFDDEIEYDIFRHYPDTGQITGAGEKFRESAEIWMRPFDTFLYEIVPSGDLPAISKQFKKTKISSFKEKSGFIDIAIEKGEYCDAPVPVILTEQAEQKPIEGALTSQLDIRPADFRQSVKITGSVSAADNGGILHISVSGTKALENMGKNFSAKCMIDGRETNIMPVLGLAAYPSCWQAWRIGINAKSQPQSQPQPQLLQQPQPFVFNINSAFADQQDFDIKAYFIPFSGSQDDTYE